MIIKLVNDKVIAPSGKTDIEPYGVVIEGLSNKMVIPYSQIKWIYQGADFKDEAVIYETSKKKKTKPLQVNISNQDLIKELWK